MSSVKLENRSNWRRNGERRLQDRVSDCETYQIMATCLFQTLRVVYRRAGQDDANCANHQGDHRSPKLDAAGKLFRQVLDILDFLFLPSFDTEELAGLAGKGDSAYRHNSEGRSFGNNVGKNECERIKSFSLSNSTALSFMSEGLLISHC